MVNPLSSTATGSSAFSAERIGGRRKLGYRNRIDLDLAFARSGWPGWQHSQVQAASLLKSFINVPFRNLTAGLQINEM